jgi:soluble lytic murein transglycosylase-like protein
MSAAILALLLSVAQNIGVPSWLLQRVAWVESRGNPHCRDSSRGAQGLMQLSPTIQRKYGVTDPWDARQSAEAGARYLLRLRRLTGNWRAATAAYGCGLSGGPCTEYVRLVYAE